MAGLVATIIEAPEKLQGMVPPSDHLYICASYPQPYYGNAAGNSGLNMTGADTVVQPGSTGLV